MDLRLWQSFLYRRDVQALSKETRMTLIELAACIAQGEMRPDGFVSAAIPAWLNQPLEQTILEIDELVKAGFLTPDEELGGWYFVGWLTKIKEPRPGRPEYEQPSWGQRSIAKIEGIREGSAKRQQKHRAKKNQVPEGVDPETGEIIQNPNPPF